jgi:hypothetical protein
MPWVSWLGAAAIYLEMLGKGGLWGVGADYQITERIRLGAVASLSRVDDETLTSVTPYAAASLVRRGHHAWYVDGGPHIAHLSTPSPVPEWHGMSSTGIGFDASTGYEYRDRIVVRAFAMAAIGGGGVEPWAGVSIGWEL